MPGIRFGARRGVLLKGTGVVAVTYSITHATINEITETINKLSFDYELSTGFNFDETTNKIFAS